MPSLTVLGILAVLKKTLDKMVDILRFGKQRIKGVIEETGDRNLDYFFSYLMQIVL